MPTGDQGFQVVIDPSEWYRLKKELDSFDPELARALRRRIRNAGALAVDAVKAKLGEPAPGGGDDSVGGRAALAAATRMTVSFGKRSAGTRVVTSASKLPAEHKGLLNVYAKKQFRHPLFGDKNHWYPEAGNPYFRPVIYKLIDSTIKEEIRAALDDAVRAIGGRGK